MPRPRSSMGARHEQRIHSDPISRRRFHLRERRPRRLRPAAAHPADDPERAGDRRAGKSPDCRPERVSAGGRATTPTALVSRRADRSRCRGTLGRRHESRLAGLYHPEPHTLTAPSSPIAEPMKPPARGRHAGPAPQPPALDRHDLRRRLLTVLVLAVCVVTVLLAVPDLRPVVREIADMNPAVVAAAVALELASCLSFVVIFRLFFRPIPRSVAGEMAWSQMGSGALLPGGGVGSLAVGGWVLHLAGMPTRQIVQRSSGLFFLTSAINVLTLAAAGLLLLLGIGDGPPDVLRTGRPVMFAVAVRL